MAESTTPARKPAAKRTTKAPTKAASLKALGLTAEDLKTLEDVKKARELAEKAKEEIQNALEEVKQSIPEITEKPDSESTTASVGKKEFYARNLRNAEAAIRLGRNGDRDAKRLEFKPRGQRGDLVKLSKKDLNNEYVIGNIGLLIEIVTADEARKIIEKQTINIQQRVHPAMASLRNSLGKEYEQDSVIYESEDKGVVVAQLNPQGGGAGNLPSAGRAGIDWQAARNLGGNPAILSDGFADAARDAAVQADIVARRKDIEGPSAAGIRSVTVAPVEKS